MTRTEAEAMIDAERKRAYAARAEGNEGKVRVCARRAAGVALSYWLGGRGREDWGRDALSRLKALREEPAAPQEVRGAAGRLTARITPDFTSPHGADPLDDAELIIRWLMQG
jgi:hypothetical protein